jgi:hypothetical protein
VNIDDDQGNTVLKDSLSPQTIPMVDAQMVMHGWASKQFALKRLLVIEIGLN